MLELLEWITEFFGKFGNCNYIIAVLTLIIAGYGVPIPRNIILASVGIFSGLGILNVHLSFAMCFLTIIGTDLSLWCLGYNCGPRLLKNKFLRKYLTPSRFAVFRRILKKHGAFALFTGSFISGFRTALFIFSGITRKIPLHIFLFMDLLSAILCTPATIYLSWYFALELPKLVLWINKINLTIVSSILCKHL